MSKLKYLFKKKSGRICCLYVNNRFARYKTTKQRKQKKVLITILFLSIFFFSQILASHKFALLLLLLLLLGENISIVSSRGHNLLTFSSFFRTLKTKTAPSNIARLQHCRN